MNEAEQAQREVTEATGQVVGLAADLVAAAADTFRMAEKNNYNQDPSIPSLEDGDRDLKAEAGKNVDVVVDSAPSVDFTKGQIPQDLGIPELKGVDPQKIVEVDKDLARSWGFALSDVNRVNQSRRSIGADMQGHKEREAVESIQSTKESLQKQIKDKGYTNQQLLGSAGIQQEPSPDNPQPIQDNGVGAVLDKIDNAPAPIPDKAQEKIDNAPAYQPPAQKTNQSQSSVGNSEAEKPESEQANLQGQKSAQETNNTPEPQPAQQRTPTASTPRQAKAEVKTLGKSIESQLKDILKADKVEARIYSGSRMVYPPNSQTKISPEMSDKLNRAFSDPQSVKGTITLSIRGDDGKLNPVYKVSNGKVVKDDYGLQKAIAQSLPEVQKVDQAPEQKTQQPESKLKQDIEQSAQKQPEQEPETPKAEQTAVQQSELNSLERQNSINQSSPEPRVRRPTTDEVIGRQSQRIKDQQGLIKDQRSEIESLRSQLEKSQKLESQLRKAKVPIGLITGIQNHAQRLGDRIKNLGNTVQAKASEKARGALKAVDSKLTDVETNTVYRASAYLAKEYGRKQADGSQQFTANNQYNINLKKDGSLTVSRVNGDKATIFAGNQKHSRFKAAASLKELNQVKSLPLAVGKIRHEQQQSLRTQQQAQTQQNSRGVGRKR